MVLLVMLLVMLLANRGVNDNVLMQTHTAPFFSPLILFWQHHPSPPHRPSTILVAFLTSTLFVLAPSMSKPATTTTPWTPEEDEYILEQEAKHTPFTEIAEKLNTRASAVRVRWKKLTAEDRKVAGAEKRKATMYKKKGEYRRSCVLESMTIMYGAAAVQAAVDINARIDADRATAVATAAGR